jgi:hypothetical protein
MNNQTLLLGAVAYDPKVVTIWEGFKAWFLKNGLGFDYMLYSNYERQVEAHLAGHFHVAWNSPLAWIRAERMARALGKRAEAIAMRDTDQDLTSVIVVRSDATVHSILSRSPSTPARTCFSKKPCANCRLGGDSACKRTRRISRRICEAGLARRGMNIWRAPASSSPGLYADWRRKGAGGMPSARVMLTQGKMTLSSTTRRLNRTTQD